MHLVQMAGGWDPLHQLAIIGQEGRVMYDELARHSRKHSENSTSPIPATNKLFGHYKHIYLLPTTAERTRIASQAAHRYALSVRTSIGLLTH